MGVNDPFIPVDYMRYMLKYDTVHGRFPNTVEVAGDSIAVGGEKVKVFGERDPSRAVRKSTSELGYYGDNISSMAWVARNLISTQVLTVSMPCFEQLGLLRRGRGWRTCLRFSSIRGVPVVARDSSGALCPHSRDVRVFRERRVLMP